MRKLVMPFALLLALVALGLAACGDDSGDSTSSDSATFQEDGYPFTFEYPSDWGDASDITVNNEVGTGKATNLKGVGPADNNGIFLATYTTSEPITEDNLDQAKSALDQLVGQAEPSASGQTGDVGGFPSVTFQGIPVADPAGAETDITALFDGTSEYFINCQWTSEHEDEVKAACSQLQSTLQKTG